MQVLTNSLLMLSLLCSAVVMTKGVTIIADKRVPEQVAKQAQIYAQQLDIEPSVYIAISFSRDIPSGVSGYTRYRNIEQYNGSHQVHIVISPDMNQAQQMRTLAHEMIHAKQFVEGRLIRCDHRHYSWGEGTCLDVKRIPYYNRPWEKEALKLGNQLYYTCKRG